MFGMDQQGLARRQEEARCRAGLLRERIRSLEQDLAATERELAEMQELIDYVPMTAMQAAAEATTAFGQQKAERERGE